MSGTYPCGTPKGGGSGGGGGGDRPGSRGPTTPGATPSSHDARAEALRLKNHDGHQDGLRPLHSLDLGATGSVDALVRGMGGTSFGGRSLGAAADVLEAMVRDEQCHVVLTLSGAMTIAKQGLVICEMIDRGWVQAVVSTGALMAHGLVESLGMQHFAHDPSVPDDVLFERGYNRVYDTIELEQNLDDTQLIVAQVLDGLPTDRPTCSHEINAALGKYLTRFPGRGPLKSAYEKGVPVYVPAFTDSEMGLDVATNNHARRLRGDKPISYDPFLDLDHFHRTFTAATSHGIFTIGGGVPRNWAQQIAPYIDILSKRVPAMARDPLRYRYAVRICPEPVHWGGLSGCDYSESVSWGKIVPAAEGGRWAEVKCDATVAWPLVVRAVMERLGV